MLRIKNWRKNFETERTAKFKRRQQIDISTDLQDMNLIWLLTGHKNGVIHFAVWVLLCEWYAGTTPPREGWITHNGKKDGIPLEAKDLKLQIHISEAMIKESLERLLMPNIGWIEEIPVERSGCAAQEQSISSKQAASPILSHPTSPHLTPSKEEVATGVPTDYGIYADFSRSFLEKQKEQFPNESALNNSFSDCVIDGANKLRLFHTKDNWENELIEGLLDWILGDEFWQSQIRTLGGIRIRKQGKGNPMKFENALAAMNQKPQHESVTDFVKRTYPKEDWGEEP